MSSQIVNPQMSPSENANPAPAVAQASESDIYDRQIRLWGADAQVSSIAFRLRS
jgi:hypothetical protein